MWENGGSAHVAYINDRVKPQGLMITYEKGQDSEGIASFTSGKEMKSYNGIFKLWGSSSFNTSRKSSKRRLFS